jgi:UDP-N-acetylmuramate dehydrogenase
MADRFVRGLAEQVRGEVRPDEPLRRHTTLRVGGPAAAFVVAEDPADLVAVARACADHGKPWLVLGRGSNVLVADGGWPGAVVILGRAFRGVVIDGDSVEAGAAEPMPALATEVARAGLGGLEFGIAIPGTLGGAVRMNAGAHGGEMRDVLDWADVARLAKEGEVERWSAADLGMRYRHTDLPPDGVVVRAGLRLAHVDADASAAAMKEMRRWRREHQPLSDPTCGSVFANPEGDSAGGLIERAGLKGRRVGGARVSEKHANFIATDPDATAADVLALVREIQRTVLERDGVALRTEVQIVGFAEEAP